MNQAMVLFSGVAALLSGIMDILIGLYKFIWEWIYSADEVVTIIESNDNYVFLNKSFDLRINSNNPKHVSNYRVSVNTQRAVITQIFICDIIKSSYIADLYLNKPWNYDPSHRTVQTYLRLKMPSLVNPELVHEFYFAHRLDYATSGVLCIPKTVEVCRHFCRHFRTGATVKYYIAIVRGIISKEAICIRKRIGEDSANTEAHKMCTVNNNNCVRPKDAMTFIYVLETGYFEGYLATKVLIRPFSGRRHQIRVHCSSLGHSIVGDYTYSNKKDIEPTRMYLHALRISFPDYVAAPSMLKPIVDVRSPDPFATDKLIGWVRISQMRILEESYKLIDEFAKESIDYFT